MAVIFIIAGGIVGFASALVAFFIMGASAPMALAIWSGSGLLALMLGVSMTIAPRRTIGPGGVPESAT